MSSVSYRDFQDKDLEAVATVWRESWRSMNLNIASPLSNQQGCRERIQRELQGGWRVTVAWEDDKVIGFLATKPQEGVLDQLFINPAAKGRGIGTGLLLQAMAEMPGGFWLRSAEANRVACAFYETHGLRRDRIEPHPLLGHSTVIYAWP